MMFALTGYFFRRHWKKLLIFLAAVFALSVYILFAVRGALPATTQIQHTDAGLQVSRQVTGMKIYEDPSAFTHMGLMQCFAAFMAVWLMWRERRFLITLSLTRGRVLLGSFGYLLVLSLLLTAAYVILPILGRGILWLCGFHLQWPWSVEILLFGGDPLWWRDVLAMFTGTVMMAGVWTLIAAVWVRWWKPILLLGACLLALVILFASQIRWLSMIAELEVHAARLVIWIFDEMIPAVLEFMDYTAAHYLRMAALDLGAGVICALVSWPVIRGMKNIK